MKELFKCKYILRKMSHALECILAFIILMGVILGSFDVIKSLWEAYVIKGGNIGVDQFNIFLGHIISLVIGLELVIMCTLHSSKALLEVLVFAIAHKLILTPKGQSMGELLLGIIGIGCLFAIKKYLICKDGYNLSEEKDVDMDCIV